MEIEEFVVALWKLWGCSREPVGRMMVAAFTALLLLASFATSQPPLRDENSTLTVPLTNEKAMHTLDSIGGYFIENRGQVNDLVRYYSTGNPAVAFRDDGVMFVVKRNVGGQSAKPEPDSLDPLPTAIDYGVRTESFAYMVHFEGANKVLPEGVGLLPFKSNFFIGKESGAWRTNASSYEVIVYRNIFDGIDLAYSPSAKGAKYEFRVRPGADPSAISMRYESLDGMGIDSGDLLIRTPIGQVRDSIPFSHQDGTRVECAFAIRAPLTVGIDCEHWNRSRALVIDPLVYSTFLGGNGQEMGLAAAQDGHGNVVVTGVTYSMDFPATPGANDTSFNGGYDAFVAKLRSDGTSLEFATFLGGSKEDIGRGVTVDSFGSIYVSGETGSTDFPVTAGAFDTKFNSSAGYADGFVVKLGSTGSTLTYATFLGAASIHVFSVAVDGAGNAYLTGETNGNELPVTPGAFNTSQPRAISPYVVKLNRNGSDVVFGTFLGGGDEGRGTSIAVDRAGNAYVTGYTIAPDFPVTPDAFDRSYDSGDSFVTKLNASGDILLYSTFLGGTLMEYGNSIAVDFEGNAYVAGETLSPDFPTTPGAYEPTLKGGTDVYLAKLNVNGSALAYATFLGGTGYEEGNEIAVDYAGNAWVTGRTDSADFPATTDAFQGIFSGGTYGDCFLTKLNAAGSALLYSTFLGGAGNEIGWGVAVDLAGYAYAVGETFSPDFPVTPGSLDESYNGGGDVFIVKLNSANATDLPDLAITPFDISLSPGGPVVAGAAVDVNAFVHNPGSRDALGVSVRFHDGPPSGSNQIGSDRFIPGIWGHGGVGLASTVWIAGLPGGHAICVVVDPDNRIVEINEDNNQACAPIVVLPLPMPDLTVSSADFRLSPAPPYAEGYVIGVNATIHNFGIDISSPTVARFHDGVPPSPQIGGDQSLESIAAGEKQNVSVMWTASPRGNHEICVIADPDNLVDESDETNNVACVTVVVESAPITKPDYLPVQAEPSPSLRIGLSMPITLSIAVRNVGNDTATASATVAFYEQSSPPFSTFLLNPLAPATNSSRFTATWISLAIPGTCLVSVDVDYDNKVTEWDEMNNVYMWTIEVVSGPVTSLVIGSPNYTTPAMATYVKSTTSFSLSVLDQSGLGIRNTTYRIDGGAPVNYTATGLFFLVGEGEHTVEWRSQDWAGNLEDVSSKVLTVDDTPPATAISIGEPKYLTGGFYVNSSTPLIFSAVDTGVGSNSTFYRLWNGSWSYWRNYSTSFSLAGRDGIWFVEFPSFDFLGNVEVVRNETLILDDTPPVSTISPAAPFNLTAADSGCGVNVTMYRIDGGSWTVYTGGFSPTEGEHTIYYYSIDNLGNVEQERSLVVRPTTEVAVNYKPIVALMFAIILLVAGVWSSRKRPWKGRKERMAAVKAFVITSVPFILAEAFTGIFSFWFDPLRMPPLLGAGTAIDAAILLAGIVVAVLRMVRTKQSGARETSTTQKR